MNDFLSQIQCDEFPQEDWTEYSEYLDSIGYDHGDDDWDEDPDAGHGFQNLDTDCPF